MRLTRTIAPGTRVRIQQVIRGGNHTWTSEVEGVVLDHRAETTGSWYVHMPGDKLWLNRLRLRKDDGEITMINLDRDSVVTILSGASGR